MTCTVVEGYLAHAEHDVAFYKAKLESELGWLEGDIRDLRRAVESGSIFEQRNLVAKAADVSEVSGKLRAALERLEVLRDIASDGAE